MVFDYIYLPVKRYGQHTNKTNKQLKVNPVVYEIGEYSAEACSYRPEVFDDCTSERAMFRSEQFARHHKTGRNYSLTTNPVDLSCTHRLGLKTIYSTAILFRL